MLRLISNLMTSLSNILISHEVGEFDKLAESIYIYLFEIVILHHRFLSMKNLFLKRIDSLREKTGMF